MIITKAIIIIITDSMTFVTVLEIADTYHYSITISLPA